METNTMTNKTTYTTQQVEEDLVRRRFYLSSTTWAYLEEQANKHSTTPSIALEALLMKLKLEEESSTTYKG